jgi:hypothetical protein
VLHSGPLDQGHHYAALAAAGHHLQAKLAAGVLTSDAGADATPILQLDTRSASNAPS